MPSAASSSNSAWRHGALGDSSKEDRGPLDEYTRELESGNARLRAALLELSLCLQQFGGALHTSHAELSERWTALCREDDGGTAESDRRASRRHLALYLSLLQRASLLAHDHAARARELQAAAAAHARVAPPAGCARSRPGARVARAVCASLARACGVRRRRKTHAAAPCEAGACGASASGVAPALHFEEAARTQQRGMGGGDETSRGTRRQGT